MSNWFVVLMGVGTVFVGPYYRATLAELYICLRENILASGSVTPAELNLAPPPPPPYRPMG